VSALGAPYLAEAERSLARTLGARHLMLLWCPEAPFIHPAHTLTIEELDEA